MTESRFKSSLRGQKRAHFDAAGLLQAALAQPIGLAITTNHPAGFRRLLYLEMRKQPHLRVRCLQSPRSSVGFYLVKPDYIGPGDELEEGADFGEEHDPYLPEEIG